MAREPPDHITVEQLDSVQIDTNAELLERLKADPHADKLMKACQDDSLLPLMVLVPVDTCLSRGRMISSCTG